MVLLGQFIWKKISIWIVVSWGNNILISLYIEIGNNQILGQIMEIQRSRRERMNSTKKSACWQMNGNHLSNINRNHTCNFIRKKIPHFGLPSITYDVYCCFFFLLCVRRNFCFYDFASFNRPTPKYEFKMEKKIVS